jgi:hypothetical protein
MSEIDGFTKPLKNDPTPTQVPEDHKAPTAPETYLDRLEKEKIKLEEAMAIIDEMVRKDIYTESFPISKTVNVVLATRNMKFTDYLNRLLDKVEIERFSLYTQISSMNQVAASLVSYGKEILPPFQANMDEKVWKEVMDSRIKFVEQIPSPIYLALLNRLSNFDKKVNTVFSEGYEENF